MFTKLKKHGRVVIIEINRPKALNALHTNLALELIEQMETLDQSSDVGCFIIIGQKNFFSVGADIKEMQTKSFEDMHTENFFSIWERFTSIKTPKVAAISGYALGGGCELVLMCDLAVADETAVFGQPEITLGVIPGIGATQRLTKLLGKARAMDLILTGKHFDAKEALQYGVISRIYKSEDLLQETLMLATQIASYPKIATTTAVETINMALEVSLSNGLTVERRNFHSLFASKSQHEGMKAFIEKRKPQFNSNQN